MAEFIQVMKDWARMCASMQGGIAKCDNCPLLKLLCQYKPNENVDLAGAEKIIEKWAEDNPEPVYPTWIKWLKEVGAFSSVDVPDHISSSCEIPDDWFRVILSLFSNIPADIAERLGLKPKEVRH